VPKDKEDFEYGKGKGRWRPTDGTWRNRKPHAGEGTISGCRVQTYTAEMGIKVLRSLLRLIHHLDEKHGDDPELVTREDLRSLKINRQMRSGSPERRKVR